MNKQKIVFIGAGNMGRCLITGLIHKGYDPTSIHVIDPHEDTRKSINNDFQINTQETPKQSLKAADVVILAVKPQIIEAAINGIRSLISKPYPLILSVAAGIPSSSLLKWLGDGFPLIRSMPNTPAMVGSGATALYAAGPISADHRQLAESIMQSVGITLWVEDETLMDAITAVSGSGPAYFFRMMESMEKAAIELGLSQQQARQLISQTAYGAAKMVVDGPLDPATLRQQVTSPKGTTERALQVLSEYNIDDIFAQTLQAACNRSTELARELDN